MSAQYGSKKYVKRSESAASKLMKALRVRRERKAKGWRRQNV